MAGHTNRIDLDSITQTHGSIKDISHAHDSYSGITMRRIAEMSQHRTVSLNLFRHRVYGAAFNALPEIQKWRRQILILLKSIREKSSETNKTFSKRFHRFLILELGRLLYMLRRAISLFSPPKAFVQQILASCSVMLTGPPVTPTGLPVFNLVTTWGRVI